MKGTQEDTSNGKGTRMVILQKTSVFLCMREVVHGYAELSDVCFFKIIWVYIQLQSKKTKDT